ncbi:MAG: hypothetical protein JSR59_03780 [Proteobacteria bacterium]|nr:hypothetical protein [Pseudomonadota bacterium]
MRSIRKLLVALPICLTLLGCGMLHAATLRVASAFDPQTMDPHAIALLYHTRIVAQVYESLLSRDEQFRLEPAGFPNGFAVTFDCVNVPWREAVCQAISAMLTQVGIRTTMRSTATNQFFPKLTGATASFAEFGWSPTTDAWASLNAILHSYDGHGAGSFNGGRYVNPQLDALIDALRVEPDLVRRRTMVGAALKMAIDDLALVPLYRRTLVWAMNRSVHAVIWPNDTMELRWVRMP